MPPTTTTTLKERFVNLAAHVLRGDFDKHDGLLDEQALRDQVFRWANYATSAPRDAFEPVPGLAVTLAPSHRPEPAASQPALPETEAAPLADAPARSRARKPTGPA